MQISAHFTLEEMTRSEYAARRGWSNEPDQQEIENLKRLCLTLEQVRLLVNKPIIVTSGYRSPNVNSAIGGSKNSQHMLGCAADIRAVGMTPDDLMIEILDSKIQYDQLIREFDSWVHISVPNVIGIPPRKQALIIDKSGTRGYS